jgi:hypothetical protein
VVLILAASVLDRRLLGLESDRALASKEKALRHCKAPAAQHGLSYLAFALGFVFPSAQRCFNSRDNFFRAATLMRLRLLRVAVLRVRFVLPRPMEVEKER